MGVSSFSFDGVLLSHEQNQLTPSPFYTTKFTSPFGLRALILGTPDYSIQTGKLDCRTSPEADRFHHELQQGQ
jgi:hypothetical protein